MEHFRGAAHREASLIGLAASRAPNAYNLFVKNKMAEPGFQAGAKGEGLTPMAKCGAIWKTMSDADKAPWQAQAVEAKANFVPGPPKRRQRPSGYNMFCKALAADPEFMRTHGTTFSKTAGEMWKNTPENVKQEYNDQAAELDIPDGPAPRKLKKDGPKRKLSGYNLFVRELSKDPDFSSMIKKEGTTLMSAAALAWKQTASDVKDEYNKLAARQDEAETES